MIVAKYMNAGILYETLNIFSALRITPSMADLCTKCRGFGYQAVLEDKLRFCQLRQSGTLTEHYGSIPRKSYKYRHHDDIFAVRDSATVCQVCAVISAAIQNADPKEISNARGLPILFRQSIDGITVGYGYPTKPEITEQGYGDEAGLLSADAPRKGEGSGRNTPQTTLQLPQLPTFQLYMNNADVK
jgi:hypothetical protein